MEYNYSHIGDRIRTERKTKGWSQTELINRLAQKGVYIGRNTLSSLENGEIINGPFDFIPTLCQLFDCDSGYLLCEYDQRSSIVNDICEYINLPEETVYAFHKSKPAALFISYLVSNNDFRKLVKDFDDFADSVRTSIHHEDSNQKSVRDITASEAKQFIMEYQLISAWQNILNHLKEGGYKEYWRIIRAAYGAYQVDD